MVHVLLLHKFYRNTKTYIDHRGLCLVPPNLSESMVSCMPPVVTQRAEHAPLRLVPNGAYSLVTDWKCPRGGLPARRRAGWKSACCGVAGSGAEIGIVCGPERI